MRISPLALSRHSSPVMASSAAVEIGQFETVSSQQNCRIFGYVGRRQGSDLKSVVPFSRQDGEAMGAALIPRQELQKGRDQLDLGGPASPCERSPRFEPWRTDVRARRLNKKNPG